MRDEFLIDRQGKKAVLYAGLLDQAHEEGLKVITTTLIQAPTPENGQTAICHAHVETSKGIFEGIGDANPGNVTKMLVGHIIRMAETRAKARALRDAINVGVVSLEELDDDEDAAPPAKQQRTTQQRPAAAPQQVQDSPAPIRVNAGPMPAQINEFERHRVRLGWTPEKFVGWVKSRSDGRGPRELTADEAADALNALGVIPTPGQPQQAQGALA